jgi:NTP pyrophosphatase (non-canonical NTP hydrolase)
LWGLRELRDYRLNDLAAEIFENAKRHGFHKKNENISEKLMLIVSELGEACEALRKGKRFSESEYIMAQVSGVPQGEIFEQDVKDTFEDELADVLIRTFDLMASMGIDVDFHVLNKMRYNESRPYKHGKKF